MAVNHYGYIRATDCGKSVTWCLMAVNHYGYIRATDCGKSVSNLVFNGSQPLRLYQGHGLWEVNHYGYIRATGCGKSTITVISGPRTVGSQ